MAWAIEDHHLRRDARRMLLVQHSQLMEPVDDHCQRFKQLHAEYVTSRHACISDVLLPDTGLER